MGKGTKVLIWQFALVLLVVWTSWAPAVYAQAVPTGPLNLTTSPLPVSLTAKPGQTITNDIRIKNSSTQTETLKVGLLKFGASGEDGRPELQDRTPTDSYFDWVSFSEQTFKAEPNVWKTIRMTIKVPQSAAFGYYYATTFTRSNPAKPEAGQTNALQGGVATLVLLDVSVPGAKRTTNVVSFTASKKLYEFLPANFTIKLRNSGNVHVAPVGTIFIKKGDEQLDTIKFNAEHGNILPSTNRIFTAEWSNGFPVYKTKPAVGSEKPEMALKWDLGQAQKLRFGHYTANLLAVYDDGQRDVPVEASVSFWVVPWRLLGVLVLIGLFVAIGLWAFIRSILRKFRRPKPDKKGKQRA